MLGMNNINMVTIALILVFLYPLIRGFLFKFSSYNLKSDINEINRSISFILALFLGIYFGRKVFIQHDSGIYKKIYISIPADFLNYIQSNTLIIYAVIIPVIILIIYKIIKLSLELINCLTVYPMLDIIEKSLSSKGNFFRRLTGLVFQLPKAICYLLLVTLALNILSMFSTNAKLNKYLEASKPYNIMCKEAIIPITNSTIAKKLPSIIDNSFKIVIKQGENKETAPGKVNNNDRTVVYYNGVTLDQGVKSNDEINKFSKSIVSKEDTTKGKAKIIYNWIGKNIAYDHDKANKVLNNDFNVQSGAIYTYDTRKGICFDYSCLYVAMCRANGIKVRLITGEGFNGVSWVSHAWNQVYLPEEQKWINVDSTFYRGGNYFNSQRFQLDHKNAQIAGEW
ncbi:transglutaminase [Clostridium carboxidivorans P7]|uniref:Transglutaminase domain protein n=1 Tax=Clostridium carboxidivorans P7 TaxID=536227 RepID=C6PZI9_9CLOT|nr:transglutaminase-like domain-containing protein [Clostridium carboxidivorans]AKN32647.1 transglutaminase [Clostridium carboxidivorans P7]EET85337.1 transglutaminase domain protein [Clostridium carboxidivorans P7]EFG90127.1 transglutaminase-like family protein [Clostridium carboxidivorans P7]